MKLKDLLSVLSFYEGPSIDDDFEINSVEMDSRKVKKGDLFICINGFTVDGHDFAENAVENGAAAIIAEREVNAKVPVFIVSDTSRALAMLAAKYYDHPSNQFLLFGITGTNGKTTITYILDTIFKNYKKNTAIIGTIQMKIGDEIYPIVNTTPDALALQKSFATMVEKDIDCAFMEVSSHALDLGRVYGCDFDIAIFTNLSQDHLDYHNDMDDYLRAKSLLFSQLGNSYGTGNAKFAIINEDDASKSLLKKSTAQHVLTYGCINKADVMAEQIELHVGGTSFILRSPVGSIAINSKLIGMFNVYNMLAASAAAIAAGVPLTVIKHALEQINGVSGRFQPVHAGQPYGVIVDYAHTPDSLENVLKTVKEFASGKVYVVVGCGGDRDRKKRPLMAQIAVKYGDLAIFTSDNPRTEDPERILDDMIAGVTESSANYESIVNRKEAIERAVQLAEKGDVILIAGKGHETYQQIGLKKYDFDDRVIAKEAILAKEK